MVISNAGYGVFGAAEELGGDQVEAIMATNLTAGIQLIHAVLPHMREAGGGRIVALSSYGGQSPTRCPAYVGTPARSFGKMLDPANGLTPGDPPRIAAAIIDSVDQQPAPLRIVLGSQALESTITTLRKRIADFEAQRALAASTDYPSGE